MPKGFAGFYLFLSDCTLRSSTLSWRGLLSGWKQFINKFFSVLFFDLRLRHRLVRVLTLDECIVLCMIPRSHLPLRQVRVVRIDEWVSVRVTAAIRKHIWIQAASATRCTLHRISASSVLIKHLARTRIAWSTWEPGRRRAAYGIGEFWAGKSISVC
ncbi:hypothetical protein IWX91DRAFT_348658 [Phyllosticta citricarpa]